MTQMEWNGVRNQTVENGPGTVWEITMKGKVLKNYEHPPFTFGESYCPVDKC